LEHFTVDLRSGSCATVLGKHLLATHAHAPHTAWTAGDTVLLDRPGGGELAATVGIIAARLDIVTLNTVRTSFST